MLVVADTSPLNYLVWIEAIDILPKLFAKVVIPPEVQTELLDAGAAPVVRAWAAQLPNWIEVQPVSASLRDMAILLSLDAGERAAIALAQKIQAQTLLIDERRGTKLARQLGLDCTGTLGVLDRAAQRQLLSLPEALNRLKATTFRYPPDVVADLLNQDAIRRGGHRT